ncbi:leukocyte elastase inhibitor-like [Photinus pyralis]|uniref:leukocyte elastase inhibitor-like n=1 Tax=Photinus pyralis TaxID=7054 RepID=UPI00126750F8|nr:leukocyte elastase inhibitor-like [Photinus pyralis]
MRILVLLSTGLVLTFAQNSALLQEFIAGNQRFTVELYKEVRKGTDGNFLINPLSLQMIMSLALIGESDEDFRKIFSTLQRPEATLDESKEMFTQIVANLDKTGDSTIASANKIFVKKGLEIGEDLKVSAVNNFKSEIEEINFLARSSISKINRWVGQNTFDEGVQMVTDKSFSKKTKSVLVNLQYFKGYWQKSFPTRATKPGPFYVSETVTKQVELMEVFTNFKYAYNHSLRAQFIEIPLRDSDMFMTVILPDDKFGLPRLEERIDELFYEQFYYGPKVRFVLPKFDIKATAQLDDALRNMGMEGAIGENSGNPDDNKFQVTNVYQKAIIIVSEDGQMPPARRGKIQGTPPWVQIVVNFVADHPFLFYLKSPGAGVFFIGRYVSP